MKKIQGFLVLLALVLMGYSATLRAEDVDIYVDNAGTAGVPNVLLVMDTGANFSSAASTPCTAYGSGGAPSLGNTAGGVEQCALVDAIESLPDSAVNIGILVNNNNNFADDVRAASDVAYHETCSGTYGGCVIRKLTLMDAANKAALIGFIKSWKTSGSNSATEFNVKSGGDRTANMMQEAWAYYRGKIGMSGKNYGTSIVGAGCQKNFVIFVGNTFNVSGGPADSGTESPFNGANALTSAQVAATSDQKLKISETVNFSPATCGATSAVATTTNSNWSENWADEWARLMFQQDGGTGDQEGTQNIITYTIGVVDPGNQCKPDYPALLSTMAKYGGGKYFRTGNASEVKDALTTILNEVQAVNSVFSSASLPVSVNAEGSYLNQIYLGMFRPDASGSPRWLGNLKQYKAIRTSTGGLVMGDATGNPAISSAGTGFISPNAVSFWTKKDTTAAPDDAATGGFWKNDMKGVPPSAYDLPDGEVVEKGGAAQQLRLQNLTATFDGFGGTAVNPRRMYTYCPSGSSCNALLTHASNEFSTANTGIATAAFGSSTTVPIVSIVRTSTSALVTTNGNHGFATGTSVTISNANQSEYNVTQNVTVNSANTFTITDLPDFPTTPSAGAYLVSSLGTSPVSVVSIVRGTSTTGGNNTEVATVTTSTAHGFTTTSTIAVTGANQSAFNRTGMPSSVPSSTVFTFPVTIEPPASPSNTYQAAFSAAAYPARTVALSNAVNGKIGGSTTAAHGFWVGQSITIAGSAVTGYNGTWTIATVPSVTTFTADRNGLNNAADSTGTVSVDTTPNAVSLSRVATTDSALATASGAPSLFFGSSVGGTRTLNITKASGTATNESAYVKSNVTITCLNASCTSFTYPITVTPSASATGTIVAALSGSVSVPVAAGNIIRVASGTTATVSGVTANAFINGQSVVIAPSGSSLSSEAAYVGTWQIACTAPCTTFTFGPVTLSPATPATGANMQAYSASSPPDKDTIIKWLRGQDNYGDEKGPGGSITVRPSIHGDVLHSRPLVVNYGDTRGIVVYYGSNDGVYRAVNGNQTTAIGTVPAGGELWGLVLPEHYGELNRQRLASPELKFPASTLASAQPKDYFVDGPTGAYQRLTATGSIDKAYIYLTMRRGGRMIYAMDVSDPTAPTVLWKIDSSTAGFSELGQTWSRPRATLLQMDAAATTPTPVLIFGAGYDAAEDTEPPGTDSMGRGIYIVNALTGALIWSANSTCTTSATCLNVPAMKYAIPSDIAFVDRNGDGYTDKLYFGDLGGNLWRADVHNGTSTSWTVTKVAALGCSTGVCAAGTTPRKFFFPPAVLTVKASGATGSYDAVSLASGDREHPLKSTAAGSSYNVADKFFMIMDTGTVLGTPVTTGVTMPTLFNATSTQYDGTLNGFYMNFATGEKSVNAPLALSGFVFFATNRPIDRTATCAANLGEAKAYAVSPFLGTQTSNVLAGGGLPPSAVSGLISIDGTTEKFCIGCGISELPGQPPGNTGGGDSSECDSALGICNPPPNIPKNLRRTYWYKK